MPGISGQQVLERLHTTQPDLPVVIVTGHVDAVEGLEHARAVLKKPVRRDEIARIRPGVLEDG